MAKAMRYFTMRISCLVRGHDWREMSGSAGIYDRCHRCYTEKEVRQELPSVAAR